MQERRLCPQFQFYTRPSLRRRGLRKGRRRREQQPHPVISARSDRGDRGCFQIGVAALLVKSVEQADSPFAVFLHQLFGEHLIFHLGKHGVSVAGAAITSYGAFLWKAGYANLGGIVVGIGITEILLTTLKWII